MNKQDLISDMAEALAITKVDARKVVDAFIGTTTNYLKKGEKLTLIGFGTFSVVERPARVGRNPQTGKEIKIPAKKTVKFKVGSELTDAIN